MSLAAGTRLAHYEILEPIGKGGMGEVYRARDTKLGRDVAIKVLPEEFARDKERLERFEREARLLAQLNHANIATLHGLEEYDGQQFLVMELVEGETLAERIATGPVAIDEAIPLFIQVAEGLEAAHEKGVIHRDLKPANVKITPEGKPKILDFGLAKGGFAHEVKSESPTVTRQGTETGVILGTAPYMSPEQARGKTLDKRTDIWSFACVLYEALTGRAPFLGETVSDTIARILEREPDWEALPEKTPATLRGLLRRCLRKDPDRRWHDIADARIELEEAISDSSKEVQAHEAHERGRGRNPLPWKVAALAVALAGLALWAPWGAGPDLSVRPVRMSLSLPTGQSLLALDGPVVVALSPDGTRLAYRASAEGRSALYVRDLGREEVTSVWVAEGGRMPFFSPDGAWLGFWVGGELKKVRIDGRGAAPVVLTGARPRGASWGPDDTIVYSIRTGLMKIQADGGNSEPLTSIDPDAGERFHYWPHVLPNGKGVLFSIVTGADYDDSRIVVQSFETGERRFLLNASFATYAPTGHLIYAREDTLYAVAFDLDSMEMRGTGIPVQTGVHVESGGPGSAHFSFSSDGTLVYVARTARKRDLILVDLQGREKPLAAPPLAYLRARFAPDGRRLAVAADRPGAGASIHVYELESERMSLVASEFTDASGTVFKTGNGLEWSPDGQTLAVNSKAPGELLTLFTISVNESGVANRLTEGDGFQFPDAWSKDGQRLLITDQRIPVGRSWGIHEIDLETRALRTLINPSGVQAQPTLSPDGRWIAYTSNESGRFEVYLAPYASPGAKHQVSTQGGQAPVWSPQGGTVYYRNGSRVMATEIAFRPQPAVGTPVLLFERPYLIQRGVNPRLYDISPDGQHFVMIRGEGETGPTEFKVVQNWFEELKRLVPTDN